MTARLREDGTDRGVASAVVDVAVAALRAACGGDPREAVAEPLRTALAADVVSYHDVRAGAETSAVRVVAPEWARPLVPDPRVLLALPSSRPFVRRDTSAGFPPARPGGHAGRRVPAGTAEPNRPVGATEQLVVPVLVSDHEVRAWIAVRVDVAFTQEQRRLATLLQPVLRALDARADGPVAAPVPAGGAPADAVGALTPRERVVLQLLADGLTATAIAHRLGMSPRTANKHLEHVYRKLGVRDRLAAVLIARRHGVVAAAPVPAAVPAQPPSPDG